MIDLVGIEPHPGPKGGTRFKGEFGAFERKMAAFMEPNVSKANKILNGGKRRKQKGQQNQSQAANNTRVTGVPAAFGFVAPSSYFRTSSSAQKLAQQDARGAVRVSGCALYNSGITTNATAGNIGGFTAGGSTVTALGFALIGPNEVDPRLAAVCQTYQYYAFRKIVLKYIPFVGTSTNGGLYLAISKDPEQASVDFANVGGSTSPSAGVPSQVMDYTPSLMTAVWQPAMLTFLHTGTDLWETYPNSEEGVLKRLQAAIVAIVSQSTGSPSTYGHLWLEYEIDLYVPGPPLGAN
jgi:hypothetical protein